MTKTTRAQFIVALAIVSLTSSSASPALAQDRLFVRGASGSSEIGAIGRFGQVLGAGHDWESPVIAGGRMVVRRRGFPSYEVVDQRTGATLAAPWGFEPLAFDPARPRVFGVRYALFPFFPDSLDIVEWRPDSDAQRVLFTTRRGAGSDRVAMAFAVDAELLFVRRCDPQQPGTAVVDVNTGSIVRDLAIHAATPAFEVTPDGRRVFAYGFLGLAAYDGTTGQIVSTAPMAAPSGFSWDDAGDWLTVSMMTSASNAWIEAFTADLVSIGRLDLRTTSPCPAVAKVSPHTNRVYLATGGSESFDSPPVRVFAYGGQPPTLQASAEIAVQAACASVIVRTAPGPPRRPVAAVTGRDVTLAWENVGGASTFVLEVGLARGRSDLSVFLGPDSHATFTDVPPGTYYLRLRGGNEFGGGRSSAELRVVVP